MTMRKLIFIQLIIFALHFVALSQQNDYIFKENFDNNSNNWYETDNNDYRSKIDKSKYVFLVKNNTKAFVVQREIKIEQTRDFVFECEIKKTNGNNESAFGVIFGHEGVETETAFLISGKGAYKIARRKSGNWKDLIAWTSTEIVHQKNSLNTFSIRKEKNLYKFYLNKRFLGQCNFEKFTSNKIGFIVNKAVEIEIDELGVYYSKRQIKRSQQAFPPVISIENVTFTDSNKDNNLESNEKGILKIEISNKGRGKAEELLISLEPLTEADYLDFNALTLVKEIEPNSNKTVEIQFTAQQGISAALRKFVIEISEVCGFDAEPVQFAFNTLSSPTDLQISQIAISDAKTTTKEGVSYGNGNQIIEPNETVAVAVFIKNKGGVAKNAKAQILLKTDNPNIVCPTASKLITLGDIAFGEQHKIEFYFYTNRQFEEKEIPFKIEITQENNESSTFLDLTFKLQIKYLKIEEVERL